MPFPDGRRIEPLPTSTTFAEDDGDAYESKSVEENGKASASLKTPPPSSAITSMASRDRHLLRLHGQFRGLVSSKYLQTPEELSIRIGENHTCVVTAVTEDEMRCDLSRQSLLEGKDYQVEIKVSKSLKYVF